MNTLFIDGLLFFIATKLTVFLYRCVNFFVTAGRYCYHSYPQKKSYPAMKSRHQLLPRFSVRDDRNNLEGEYPVEKKTEAFMLRFFLILSALFNNRLVRQNLELRPQARFMRNTLNHKDPDKLLHWINPKLRTGGAAPVVCAR